MSGSRGEANFVWKCKNCKVLSCLFPEQEAGMLKKYGIALYRGNLLRRSWRLRHRMRSRNRQSRGRSLSSTAEDSSSPSSSPRWVVHPPPFRVDT